MQPLGHIITAGNNIYLALAIFLTLFSITKGHISYVDARNKGDLSFLSVLVTLPAYYLVSTVVRIFAVVVFVTPVLGLFDVLQVAKMAKLPGSKGTYSDILSNGGFITIKEEWSELQLPEMHIFFSNSHIYTIYGTLGMFIPIFHLASGLIIKWFYEVDSGIDHILYTYVCPPLYFDWEDLYRKNNGTVTFEQCFRKARNAYLMFVLVFAVEHFLLCIPLMMLKPLIVERLDLLDAYQFVPLPEEEESLQITNMLLYSSLALFTVIVPDIQVLIALTYFKYGHPWSVILREEVAVFPWDKVAKHESIPMQDLRR